MSNRKSTRASKSITDEEIVRVLRRGPLYQKLVARLLGFTECYVPKRLAKVPGVQMVRHGQRNQWKLAATE